MTATNRDGKRAQYKDYVHFLHNYKQSRSEDPVDMSVKSFRDYLEDYNNKSYQPVQPDFAKPPAGKKAEEKTVKTEVFIQIGGGKSEAPRIAKTFLVKAVGADGDRTESNIYENTKNSLRKTPSLREKRMIFEDKQEKLEKPKAARSFAALNKFNAGNKEPPVKLQPSPSSTENRLGEALLAKTTPSSPPQEKTAAPAHPKAIQTNLAPAHPKAIQTNLAQAKTIPSSKPSTVTHSSSAVPPPPPLPPVAAAAAKPVASVKLVATVKPVSGSPVYNTLPKTMGSRQKDVADGESKLDKNDPRVKKMVYGALREMYGNYHDKANDYLATLPKNRVKKNNGLDSIINSIASQGGLDKLSGRMNPKLDTE